MQASPAGRALEIQVSHRLSFWLRELIRPSQLDPRIKIFLLDDRSAAALQSTDLALADWASVFTALDDRRPSRIFVDKLFDKPFTGAELASFREASRSWTTPIGVISFASTQAIALRTEMQLDRPEFAFPAPALLPGPISKLYGAGPELASAFAIIGHAMYSGDGFVPALVPMAPEKAVPHLGLLTATSLAIRGGELFADQTKVPRDREGRLQVDFGPSELYLKRAFPILPLVQVARAKQALPVVDPGDYVLILPAMYTGNTDWRETPFGSMPGGFILAALIDDVLRGDWLTPIEDGGVGIVVFGVLATFLAEALTTTGIWIMVAGFALGIPFLALSCFVGVGWVVPWILPTAVVPLVSAIVLRRRMSDAQREQQRLAAELETANLVQTSFFPIRAPNARVMAIAGEVLPATECGGDWWGHFSPAPGKDAVIIADATGHGVSAALVTAMAFAASETLDAAAKTWGVHTLTPNAILTFFDRAMSAMTGKKGTMTCFVCILDAGNRVMSYASAGHNPPLLVPRAADDARIGKRRHAFLTLNSAGGSLIGMGSGAHFETQEVELRAGDRLVLYTDGLIENRGGPKGQPWGKARLYRSIDHHRDLPYQEYRAKILAEAADYFGSTPPDDDVTLVILELAEVGPQALAEPEKPDF